MHYNSTGRKKHEHIAHTNAQNQRYIHLVFPDNAVLLKGTGRKGGNNPHEPARHRWLGKLRVIQNEQAKQKEDGTESAKRQRARRARKRKPSKGKDKAKRSMSSRSSGKRTQRSSAYKRKSSAGKRVFNRRTRPKSVKTSKWMMAGPSKVTSVSVVVNFRGNRLRKLTVVVLRNISTWGRLSSKNMFVS